MSGGSHGTTPDQARESRLVLEDGSVFPGRAFGFPAATSGEVVFNTGMVGYPEALTDPSYRGQILVLTYPLVGNYGVPAASLGDGGLDPSFESEGIQVAGLVVADAATAYSHWSATRSLGDWLGQHAVPGITGVDTRALTKRLRERGVMLGKLVGDDDVELRDPNRENLVALVSVKEPVVYGTGRRRVVLIDCGCKHSIIRGLVDRGLTVVRVPWNHDFLGEEFDGVVISNGPGDPKMCVETIQHVRRAMERGRPILGVCLGNQILALAAGADTYKLKFGHRGQNQPCGRVGTPRCYITSQNHGYAVDEQTLPPDWEPWFQNLNDGTNEGIRHRSRPFMSVQFHPEAAPGPLDTTFLFDELVEALDGR